MLLAPPSRCPTLSHRAHDASMPAVYLSRTATSLLCLGVSTMHHIVNRKHGDACVTRLARLLRSSRPPEARSARIVAVDVRLPPCPFSYVRVCEASGISQSLCLCLLRSIHTVCPSCTTTGDSLSLSLSLAVLSLLRDLLRLVLGVDLSSLARTRLVGVSVFLSFSLKF